jgi:GDP-D-mannose dehydratase
MIMKKLFTCFLILGCSTAISFAQKNEVTSTENITRILNTLASDDMEGRSALGLGIWKAADFIAAEFKAIGLKPYAEQNYKQSFDVEQKKTKNQIVKIDGKPLASEEFLMIGDPINSKNKAVNLTIGPDEDFSTRFREIMLNDSTEAKVQVCRFFSSF